MKDADKLKKLSTTVKAILLKEKDKLPLHGWHHFDFVRKKAVIFSEAIQANTFLVESAALVHDINRLPAYKNAPLEADTYSKQVLQESGYSIEESKKVLNIVA